MNHSVVFMVVRDRVKNYKMIRLVVSISMASM